MSAKSPYAESYFYTGSYATDGSGDYFRQPGPADPATPLAFSTGGGDTHGPVIATTAGAITVSMELTLPASFAASANAYYSFLQIGGKLVGGGTGGGAGTHFRGEGLVITDAYFMAGHSTVNDSWVTSDVGPTGSGSPTMYVGFLDNGGVGVVGSYGSGWQTLANYSGPLLGSANNLVLLGGGGSGVTYNNLPILLGAAGTASAPVARKLVVAVSNTGATTITGGKVKVALRGFEI